jgi:hypothetical protein
VYTFFPIIATVIVRNVKIESQPGEYKRNMNPAEVFVTQSEYTIEGIVGKLQQHDTTGRVYYIIEGTMRVCESIERLRSELRDTLLLPYGDPGYDELGDHELIDCLFADRTGRRTEIWLPKHIAHTLNA